MAASSTKAGRKRYDPWRRQPDGMLREASLPFEAYAAELWVSEFWGLEFWVSWGWAAAAGWLILRASRQRDHLPQLAPGDPQAGIAPSVTIIVPARNEAINIASCLKGLCGQSYPADRLRIAVVDDH